MTIFLGIISAIIVISYVIDFKNNRMSTKEMVMASLIAAISFVLYVVLGFIASKADKNGKLGNWF